ncbi:MAG: hypothetical protein JO252_10545, partial [Planctomycetaceae bacterium]|nr:hypothetical protein [Planctomycetaceae bacterium]
MKADTVSHVPAKLTTERAGVMACDALLQRDDDGAEGLVLLAEWFDQREGFGQGVRVRGHDPPLQV